MFLPPPDKSSKSFVVLTAFIAAATLTAILTLSACGAETPVSVVYVIDTMVPSAAITYSGVRSFKNLATSTFTATFSEVVLSASLSSTCTGTASGISSTGMTASSSTVFTYAFTAGTGDGTCTITLVAADAGGHQVSTVTGMSYTVDNTADAKPAMNGDVNFICFAQTCSILGTNVSGSTVEVSENGGTSWTSTGVTYPTATTFAYSITFTGNGIGVIARQTDPAGNVSASSTSIIAVYGLSVTV